MKRKQNYLFLFLFLFTLSSCATYNSAKKETEYAIRSMANYFSGSNQKYDRNRIATKYNYKGKKSFLKVESSRVTPEKVSRGGSITNDITLTLLLPDPLKTAKVNLSRKLIFHNDSMNLGKKEQTVNQGTSNLTSKFTIPKDADTGKYTIKTTISTVGHSKSLQHHFEVK